MIDKPNKGGQLTVPAKRNFDNHRTAYRDYSLEDRVIALATVELNGGNIYRTSRALEIPYATLYGWVEERKAGPLGLSKFEREKRGDLAAKMESVIHSLVESMHSKIPKATLSQTAVATGILVDKTRILRGEDDQSDPTSVLCALLGITPSQLPPTLELGQGEEIPTELLQAVIGNNSGLANGD